MALATSIPIILFFIVGLSCSGKIATNVWRATRSLGFGERNVLSSTNVAKVNNVSIKHNTQIFGARC
jgi:hypothetical protein